jgi:hypothetical protein
MEDDENEQQIRNELSMDYSYLRIRKGRPLMYQNIDSFVALSRENTSVTSVELYGVYDNNVGNYEFWDKVGQMVGNLIELKTLQIYLQPHLEEEEDDDDGDEARIPDWEILNRILPYLRHKVSLFLTGVFETEGIEIQRLARVIHGHPMISGFRSEMPLTLTNLGPWCSALATLPSLERVSLGLQEPETEDELVLVNLEPLQELLRAPALRFVNFEDFYFTDALCHATANALEDGSSIIDITFDGDCEFPDGGGAIIANALKRNTSVTDIKFLGGCDEPFCNTLTAVLLCNATLQNLTVDLMAATRASAKWLSSIFLSLGMNATLKSLTICTFDKFGGELGAAITSGLAMKSTLEELSLYDMVPTDDDGAVWARNAFSFLCANTTLKSLRVFLQPIEEESYISAFRLEAVKMIEDNPCLESLTIGSISSIMKVEELLALVSALQRNTSLKTLDCRCHCDLILTADEVNQLVSILRKNYGLEHLEPEIRCADSSLDPTVKAILRLNGAGRRYLIKDGSSVSKGVDVLSAVSDDMNCVFLHLLENPSLCNRRASETTTGKREGNANLDEPPRSGKRGRGQSQPAGKEPRRRPA